MKKLYLLVLLIFAYSSKAQNAMVLKTEQNINVILQQQNDIFFENNLGNCKPLLKINAFNSGQLILLEKIDSLNASIKFTVDLLTITKFKMDKNTFLFVNSNGETAAKITGLKKADARYLKKQFKKLQMLSVAYLENKKKDEVNARKLLQKEQYDLPDPQLKAKRIKAEQEAKKAFESKKSNN